MVKKKMKTIPIGGRIRSGLTTAPTSWGESVRPVGKVVVFEFWCKKCGICIEYCPTKALEDRGDGVPVLANPDKCTLCGLCWLRCPDIAIIKGPELPENRPAEEQAARTRELVCETNEKNRTLVDEDKKKETENMKAEVDNG